jgi:hypothetical protein
MNAHGWRPTPKPPLVIVSGTLASGKTVERHRLAPPERRYTFDGERIAELERGIPQDAWDRAEPVEIGAPVLRVDTTDGYRPDLDGIVAFIRAHTADMSG